MRGWLEVVWDVCMVGLLSRSVSTLYFLCFGTATYFLFWCYIFLNFVKLCHLTDWPNWHAWWLKMLAQYLATNLSLHVRSDLGILMHFNDKTLFKLLFLSITLHSKIIKTIKNNRVFGRKTALAALKQKNKQEHLNGRMIRSCLAGLNGWFGFWLQKMSCAGAIWKVIVFYESPLYDILY